MGPIQKEHMLFIFIQTTQLFILKNLRLLQLAGKLYVISLKEDLEMM